MLIARNEVSSTISSDANGSRGSFGLLSTWRPMSLLSGPFSTVSDPGLFSGSVTVTSRSRFWGAMRMWSVIS